MPLVKPRVSYVMTHAYGKLLCLRDMAIVDVDATMDTETVPVQPGNGLAEVGEDRPHFHLLPKIKTRGRPREMGLTSIKREKKKKSRKENCKN